MSTTTAEDLVSVGELARELDEPTYRIRYLIESRRMEPVRRLGILRVFSRRSMIPRLRKELRLIASRRPGPQPRPAA